MTDKTKELVGIIIAHRAMNVISLPEANRMFFRAFRAEDTGADPPRFTELLAEARA